MYFHADDPHTVTTLRLALEYAEKNNRRVRINVDGMGGLSFKFGEGMWSAPIDSTPDPYRDNS